MFSNISSPLSQDHFLSKTISPIRPDFRCTEMVKYYFIFPLKRDHSSYKATFSMHGGAGGSHVTFNVGEVRILILY
jgi:hypothetical protein